MGKLEELEARVKAIEDDSNGIWRKNIPYGLEAECTCEARKMEERYGTIYELNGKWFRCYMNPRICYISCSKVGPDSVECPECIHCGLTIKRSLV